MTAIIQCLISSVIAYIAYRLYRHWEVYVLAFWLNLVILDIFAVLKQIQRDV